MKTSNLLQITLFVVVVLFSVNVVAQKLTDSNLPIVVITTDVDPLTNQPIEIVDSPRVFASMKIIKRPDGTRNFINDLTNPAYLNYNGKISIEFRGTTSQEINKKPYGLTTLKDDLITNNNVSLLDMPSENDWILNNLSYDPSFIRDYLTYTLFQMIGNYAPRVVFCEVIVNNEYVGLYLLSEKIKADKNRVDVTKIESTDNSFPAITGGYITKSDRLEKNEIPAFELDSYFIANKFVHILPKPENITTGQDSYIFNQFQKLQTLSSYKDDSPKTGYPTIIDIPSFIDFMLINEISSNVDGYKLSTFYHKDRSGKLRAGPIWDFNLTYGNDLFQYDYDRSLTDIWQFHDFLNVGPKFWTDLFNDASYNCHLSKRWNDLTQPEQVFNYNYLSNYIDQIIIPINEARKRDNLKWGALRDFDAEILLIKNFLFKRIAWMSENINNNPKCQLPTVPNLVITSIHYHPDNTTEFPDKDAQEFIAIKNISETTVDLTGIYFKELGLTYQFPINSSIDASQTIYLASDTPTFKQKYGIAPFGQFTRNLSNKSEKLVLVDAFGNIIDEVKYDDGPVWPVEADGKGKYLQLIDVSLDNAIGSNWKAVSDKDLSAVDTNLVVNVYPNPTQNMLSIDAQQIITNIDIFDIYGSTVLSKPTNSTQTKVDLTNLPLGLYFVKISNPYNYRVKKVVKN